MRFKQLPIGERFEFDHTGLSCLSLAHGPWIKVSPRKYRAVETTEPVHTVGSINAKVRLGDTCKEPRYGC